MASGKGSNGRTVVEDEFFTRKIWLLDWEDGVTFDGLSIKVGFDELVAVVKGHTAEGPVVAFMAKRGWASLYNTLSTPQGRASLRWRPDKYRLDNFEDFE